MSTNQTTPEPDRFDGSRIKQLMQDKRFVTILTGAGVCLILIIYYFLNHTKSKEEGAVKPTMSLNSDLPNAGDSTGLPSQSKLELATNAHPLSMPDQMPMERGLNANVPATLHPDQSRRGGEADSYIYGNDVPDEIYEKPESPAPPRKKKRNQKAGTRAGQEELADDDEVNEVDPTKTKAEIEKQKQLLALLQEYKADKIKRQADLQGRALKPETVPISTVSSLNGAAGKNNFYGLQSDMRKQQMDAKEDSLSVTVKAMVFSDQTIISGGRVTLRLLESITLRGRMIPEGTRLYGVANFGGQRVNIAINQVQVEGRILPMKLTVFDMDGLSGIYVPNVVGVQQGRQAVSQAGQGFNVSAPVYSANVPAMAAASAVQAGLQGGRSFLSRKVAVQKATLKNNYYVLLK
ncbi:conjugative transposon protein TraM [Spirosoma endophyticum]|uniref:Bacteroides conjugative transposon TraM protein n=1 Tax=Spirosoma endophyticum TaxID=662367 RepID=A0A1I1ZFZ9_9BACT|nr:conjugative transposon protein TraM [Spirosoma endophyticum]SFE30575.1 Bacteroides conjugative transposon TraM protein [Spirosoma endophyticum]